MKITMLKSPVGVSTLIFAASLAVSSGLSHAKDSSGSAEICPPNGWSEGLAVYMDADATMPTAFSATADDCEFNMWSWESFVWATAKVNGIPRFMNMKTPGQLFAKKKAKKKSLLRLSSRSAPAHGNGFTEGAGAFVEADGSMLVGPNGYPVYASVHMNDSYFNTVKNNLIKDGGYTKNAGKDYFDVGAAVIKATWYRLEDGESAPAGSYTTQAEVPVLKRQVSGGFGSAESVVSSGKFETVTVALVGVHVVGYVQHHPEFLWGTFEHNMNAPMIKDNTFTTSGSDSNGYTFYKANTSYSEVLVPNQPETSKDPALLTFDDTTGKFSPITQVVQMNKTGGDNRTNGPANIASINQSAQTYVAGDNFEEPKHFKEFANYNLIGTLWMKPDTYVSTNANWQNLDQSDAQGAVNLANSTAETFMQQPLNTVKPENWGNCFECHNAKSFTYGDKGAPALPARRIAVSHIVSEGTAYAVPNMMPVKKASVTPSKK